MGISQFDFVRSFELCASRNANLVRFFEYVRSDAARVLDILRRDGLGFNAKASLSELHIRVSGLLVREVLVGILKNINYENKERSAILGYTFFLWSGQQEKYRHTVNTYHLIMKILAECEEFKAMWRLLDEMVENGFSTTARTFNILICTCGEAGLARKVVERDKPLAALNLLNHMKDVGFDPNVLHFTTLIDGLSRAGNLDACKYFFEEMIKNGCKPDVVCYTVMITGYIMAGELEKAQALFDEMTARGQLPNVFTYNSMIRGFCMAGRFKEACSMLNEMESRGCSPNFLVYSTLVSNMQNAGKLSEAREVIRQMVEKGQYAHLVSRFSEYRRC
ncbi:hypothetical protein GH714_027361 [Hevea brasiliensis]|uniref:Pentacotripeptide-repeat region of PRORP domain-containing protein n=1 Tax=Hevea brasiliensis TaxID=3981 RepID=A0A6A6N4M7_HEVBR|nr:hypothetical protein GH714_027361 [Hevea brasiliensis]